MTQQNNQQRNQGSNLTDQQSKSGKQIPRDDSAQSQQTQQDRGQQDRKQQGQPDRTQHGSSNLNTGQQSQSGSSGQQLGDRQSQGGLGNAGKQSPRDDNESSQAQGVGSQKFDSGKQTHR